MSKLSKLQQRKLYEMEYEAELKQRLAAGKQKTNKKTNILDNITCKKVRYYEFEHASGAEQLCLMLQEDHVLNNNKQKTALHQLARRLLLKGWDSWLNDSRVVDALACIAKYEGQWLQSLEHYKPISHNPYRELAHLIRFLFAQYPIPAFLDTAFYYQNDRHIRWYLHLARGGSARKLDNMPLHLTQKMLHYFLQAPPEATIPQALRYAQVLGLGGSKRLARYVMQTRLSEYFENEAFWESVLRFLVQNPMLDPRYVQPIIEFLQYIKFEPQENVHVPLEPAFSMKGRTVPALLRLVEAWQAARKSAEAAQNKPEAPNWAGFPLADYVWAEGEGLDTVTYRIKQLRTVYALREEGRTMSHCVATYYSSCIGGSTSIWSMTREDACGNTKRLITIELNRAMYVQQARGFANRLPYIQEYQILKDWVTKNRFRLSGDIEGYAANLQQGY